MEAGGEQFFPGRRDLRSNGLEKPPEKQAIIYREEFGSKKCGLRATEHSECLSVYSRVVYNSWNNGCPPHGICSHLLCSVDIQEPTEDH